MAKIIQILKDEFDLLGLGDNGITYRSMIVNGESISELYQLKLKNAVLISPSQRMKKLG
jgi:hypothetical protein